VNTVFILWLRQLKRYFRSRARMIGSLGQPILFLLALGFGLGPTFARAGGGDYVQFLAPGIITMGTCSPPSSAASRSSGTASSAF
jgi:ABC-2 type transport system permease protein